MKTPLVAEYKEFELPTPGVHAAEIVEVVDKGVVDTAWGKKHRIAFKYKLDQKDSEGENIVVMESFNLVLGERSRLEERAIDLLGARPDRRYDFNLLKGWTGQVVIKHQVKDGKTYGNVVSAIRKEEAEAARLPWEAGS
jgi:hypothetical protein